MPEENVIDFMDTATQLCPFAAYDRLRAEAPVYRDPTTGYFIVTDYELIRQAALDTGRLSNNLGAMRYQTGPNAQAVQQYFREHGEPPVNILLGGDPPEHKFHRSLVSSAFTAVRVRRMETYLTEVIDGIIDRLSGKAEVEFVSEVAMMVPIIVIADQIGWPREDAVQLKRWSDATVAATNRGLSLEEELALASEICALHRYIKHWAAIYRETPADCMLSDLVHAEVDGRRLTESELVSIVQLLFIGGNESTTNALGSGMLRLIEQPALQERLRDRPEEITAFVEEVLRMDAPIQGFLRRAVVDMEIGGVPIPAESFVMLRWAAGNRDPHKFACPAQFQLDRENGKQHLTFGTGAHLCVGNQLARGELRITFDRLLARMRNFRLSRGQAGVRRAPHYLFYGLAELYVAMDPA